MESFAQSKGAWGESDVMEREAATRIRHFVRALRRPAPLLRGFVVSTGGVLFMFCCLTILTLSSCTFGQ
jgi:hypothetical protein